jgi:hypothetical protein
MQHLILLLLAHRLLLVRLHLIHHLKYQVLLLLQALLQLFLFTCILVDASLYLIIVSFLLVLPLLYLFGLEVVELGQETLTFLLYRGQIVALVL